MTGRDEPVLEQHGRPIQHPQKYKKLAFCKRCDKPLFSNQSKKLGLCYDCDDITHPVCAPRHHLRGQGYQLDRLLQFDKFVAVDGGLLTSYYQCRDCGKTFEKIHQMYYHCRKYGHKRHRDHFPSFVDTK